MLVRKIVIREIVSSTSLAILGSGPSGAWSWQPQNLWKNQVLLSEAWVVNVLEFEVSKKLVRISAGSSPLAMRSASAIRLCTVSMSSESTPEAVEAALQGSSDALTATASTVGRLGMPKFTIARILLRIISVACLVLYLLIRVDAQWNIIPDLPGTVRMFKRLSRISNSISRRFLARWRFL